MVTDHDTGRIAWMAEGHRPDAVHAFFDAIGALRAAFLTQVSANGAEWIPAVVRARAPQAQICLDAFHIVKWACQALDKLRTRLAGELRAVGNMTRPPPWTRACERCARTTGS